MNPAVGSVAIGVATDRPGRSGPLPSRTA